MKIAHQEFQFLTFYLENWKSWILILFTNTYKIVMLVKTEPLLIVKRT